jgi:flagellar FliL protein
MANKESPEGASPEDGAAEGGKKGPPIMLIAIAAAVIVLAGSAGAYFMIFAHKPEAGAEGKKEEPPKKKAEKKEHGEKEKDKGPNAPVILAGPDGVMFYTLPPITANMQSPDGRPTYLKLKLTFELPNEEAVEVVAANTPRLQDAFQALFRELRVEDLQGSQGSYQVRMEILRRVNLVLAPTRVNAVLIEEMLIN